MPKKVFESPRRAPSGFTRIKLLRGIALIAILASLLQPALSRARTEARATHCLSNLKQWGLIGTGHGDDHDGSFGTGTGVDGLRGQWLVTLENSWGKQPRLLICPEATMRRASGTYERLVAPNAPSAVDYGGPRPAGMFTIADPDAPRGTTANLLASSGENSRNYNLPPRRRRFSWSPRPPALAEGQRLTDSDVDANVRRFHLARRRSRSPWCSSRFQRTIEQCGAGV